MIKAVLFDLDGTLIDSRQDIADAVNVGLRAVGLPERSLTEVTGFIGEGSRNLVEKAVGPHPDLFDQAHAAWERAYSEGLLHHTQLYPGMRELAEALSVSLQGRLSVHTNKPGAVARVILEGLDASHLFKRVLGSGDGSPRKPKPEGAHLLLNELGVAPADAVYIGDSGFDFLTAKNAGIPFLGCAWGYDSDHALANSGARIAKDQSELRRWLLD
jgi:phosphoglycolate phosphatase